MQQQSRFVEHGNKIERLVRELAHEHLPKEKIKYARIAPDHSGLTIYWWDGTIHSVSAEAWAGGVGLMYFRNHKVYIASPFWSYDKPYTLKQLNNG